MSRLENNCVSFYFAADELYHQLTYQKVIEVGTYITCVASFLFAQKLQLYKEIIFYLVAALYNHSDKMEVSELLDVEFEWQIALKRCE